MNLIRQIKDWVKFQHYKTGKNAKHPEWIKLYRRLLDDIEWHNLEPVAAKTLISLWLLASENGGTLPDLKTIAFRLRMPEKQIKSVLSQLPHWIEDSPSEVLGTSYAGPRPEEEGEKEEEREERAPKRQSQVPEDWTPKPETVSSLVAKGFSEETIAAELEKFRLYHRSKGTLFKDTEAGFRMWMTKAKEFAASSGGGAARKNGTGWYIKRDSAEYEAWWRHAHKISDYKLQGKLQYGGDEILVQSRWPSK
jgi:hypothetical protein